MSGAQGGHRLLNHSRFPDGMLLSFLPAQSSRRRGARPPLVSRSACGSLCRLWRQQPTGLTLPFGAPSGRFGPSAQVSRLLNHSRFPDGMPLSFLPAQSSRRALAAPTARFAVRLRVALGYAQQPTGLTLPFGAPSPVPQHKKRAFRAPERRKKRGLFPNYMGNECAQGTQRARRRKPPGRGRRTPFLLRNHLHISQDTSSRGDGRRGGGTRAGAAAWVARRARRGRVRRLISQDIKNHLKNAGPRRPGVYPRICGGARLRISRRA